MLNGCYQLGSITQTHTHTHTHIQTGAVYQLWGTHTHKELYGLYKKYDHMTLSPSLLRR